MEAESIRQADTKLSEQEKQICGEQFLLRACACACACVCVRLGKEKSTKG